MKDRERYSQSQLVGQSRDQTNLGLLGTTGGLLSLLLVLAGGNGGLTGSSTDLGLLVSLGSDGSKVGTDDTTLVLHVAARTLLGDLLRDSLLVHATEDNGPGKLTGVLALEEEGLGLGGDETERLKVMISLADDVQRCSIWRGVSSRTERVGMGMENDQHESLVQNVVYAPWSQDERKASRYRGRS